MMPDDQRSFLKASALLQETIDKAEEVRQLQKHVARLNDLFIDDVREALTAQTLRDPRAVLREQRWLKQAIEEERLLAHARIFADKASAQAAIDDDEAEEEWPQTPIEWPRHSGIGGSSSVAVPTFDGLVEKPDWKEEENG